MNIPSKFLAYWVPSIVVILISLNLHYSEFSNYVNTNPYQCEIIGGEKISGGYKTNGKMYLIAKDIKTNKILSFEATPEDYHIYHNKPGVILTYKLKGWVVSNNKTYKVYRDIFIVSIALLFAITIGSLIMSDYDSTFIHFAKSSAILFVTTIISYNLII